jgi:nitrite reductase/ring-hydroxylating ferredoxin subunit/uncharacterized membrane protein
MADQQPAPSFGNNPFFDGIVRATQDQQILQQLAGAVQPAIKRALRNPRSLKNFLHGVWVGHPLHPILTDLPIGAWTMASIFDAIHLVDKRADTARAADICVATGIAGAVGAALTGLADWSETFGRPARVGIVHATSNTLALTLYTTSYFLRKRNRTAGMFTSLLGYAMATIGAGLGGHLVYGENQGVNHAVAENLPTQWIRLLPMDELMDGKPHRAKVKERDIVLVRHSGAIHALLDSCSHLGGPLHKGTVDDCSITCPWHGSRFALVDGHVLNGPATLNQPTFESRIIDGYVEVRAFSAEAP